MLAALRSAAGQVSSSSVATKTGRNWPGLRRIAFGLTGTGQVPCGPFFELGKISGVEIFGACLGVIFTNGRLQCAKSGCRHRHDPPTIRTFSGLGSFSPPTPSVGARRGTETG